MKNKILIIGNMGVGKTTIAEPISKSLNLPIMDEVPNILEVEDKPGIYVSNSILLDEALFLKKQGFSIIQVI